MKRQAILFWVLAAVVIALGAVWFSYNGLSFRQAKNAASNSNASQVNMNTTVALPSTIAYKGEDGKNALDLLKANHEVVEEGGFITAIDKRPNTTSSYWMLYVNGKLAEKGAKDIATTSGDAIEWRFEGLTNS